MTIDLTQRISDLLARVPEAQRQAAGSLLAQYGPRLFDLAVEDAWGYLRRLMAGDLEAMAELDAKLSDDEFVARVKTNTARWEAVSNYNQVREDLKKEVLLRLATPMAAVLAALVGL
ncbi:MAG: hypothetical protein LLG01_15965 [Planctomycetaceae bacterium]|nr:hypothetical protein [Planctomycetaceae bacterium]